MFKISARAATATILLGVCPISMADESASTNGFPTQKQSVAETAPTSAPAPTDTAESPDSGSLDDLLGSSPNDEPVNETPPANSEPISPDSTDSASTAPLKTIPVVQLAKDEAPPTPIRKVQLEEIIVTATKQERSLRDIPASIAAFNGDQLESQGKLGISEFVQESPGVTLNSSGPGFLRISMRGISTDAEPLSIIPSATGILIGDTAFSDPYISNITPDLSAFDLASVEVLKGPQGTLFGGSALSGAIRYVLQDPLMGEWQGRAFSQYVGPEGGTQAFTSGLAVNMPLYEDRVALRLGYVRRQYPGVYDLAREPRQDNVDRADGDQVRAILSWQVSDAFKVKATHLDQSFDAANSLISADQRERRENRRQILAQPVNHGFDLDSIELNYDFSDMRLVSLTSHSTKNLSFFGDSTGGVLGAVPPGYPEQVALFQVVNDDSKALAQELRLQSTGSDGLRWLVGGYTYDYSVRFEILIDSVANQTLLGNSSLVNGVLSLLSLSTESLYNEATLLHAVTTPKVTERAMFFDLSETFWDDLELSVGARLYSTDVSGGFRGNGLLVRAVNNGQNVDASDNRISEKGASPKFTATFHFTDGISLWAQASRGFRFGGLQSVPSTPTNDVPPVYKSDSLWNYELGLRTSWLDETLRFDITAFRIDYKNPQIQQTANTIPLNYTDNVSAALSQGFETSLRWLTPLGLILSLDGGLTDAHITEPFTAADGTEVKPGAELPGAAKSQLAATVAFVAPIGNLNLGSSVSYNYVGEGYGDIVHSEKINDYGTLNAGITLGSDAWPLRPQLAFNVSNILDTTAVVGGATRTSSTGLKVGSFNMNQPRTFTLRLGVEF